MTSQAAVLSRQSQVTTPVATGRLVTAAYAISRCIAWIRHRQQVHRSVEILTALDDHLLADIGLMRDQIELFAEGRYLSTRHCHRNLNEPNFWLGSMPYLGRGGRNLPLLSDRGAEERSVLREIRWRSRLKVSWTAARAARKR